MKKVIVITVAILLLLSGTAVGVLYYIGDKMVDTVIDSEINDLLAQQPSTSQDISSTANEQTGTDAGDQLSQEPSDNTTGEILTPGDNSENDSNSQSDKSNGTEKSNSDQKNETSKSNASKPKPPNSDDSKIQYTVDQMIEVKDKVTATDKISSAALLVNRLSAADIDELKNMLPGGVDAAEKKRAKEIMYQRFTPEEIETIESLYQKYMGD